MQNNSGSGYLKVQTVSADGALPVELAVVTIYDSEGSLIASLRTDSSGLTETLALSAPPKALSQIPENNGTLPYSTYTITVSKDGFARVDDYSVPVFDGITAIQRVNMIPLPFLAPFPPEPRPQRIETPGYSDLESGKEISQ